MEWFNPQWIWDNMSSILITFLFGGLLTWIGVSLRNLVKEVKDFIEAIEILKEAVRTIIKLLIVIIHDDATDKGYIGRYKLEVSERLFTIYDKLKGNSYVEDLMNDLRKLPHGKRKNKVG